MVNSSPSQKAFLVECGQHWNFLCFKNIFLILHNFLKLCNQSWIPHALRRVHTSLKNSILISYVFLYLDIRKMLLFTSWNFKICLDLESSYDKKALKTTISIISWWCNFQIGNTGKRGQSKYMSNCCYVVDFSHRVLVLNLIYHVLFVWICETPNPLTLIYWFFKQYVILFSLIHRFWENLSLSCP